MLHIWLQFLQMVKLKEAATYAVFQNLILHGIHLHIPEFSNAENQVREELMPMLVRKQRKKTLKQSKLRHLEYYGMQETLDKLYADSKSNKIFTNLMEIIRSEENIKLAYRNIKKNAGSNTCGVDELTIKDIKMLTEREYTETARKKMS